MKQITLEIILAVLREESTPQTSITLFGEYEKRGVAYLRNKFAFIDDSDCLEIFHDVWLNLMAKAKLDSYFVESKEHFGRYFYVALRNKATDFARKVKSDTRGLEEKDEQIMRVEDATEEDHDSERLRLFTIAKKEIRLRGSDKYFFRRYRRIASAGISDDDSFYSKDLASSILPEKTIPTTSAHYNTISTTDNHLQRQWYMKNLNNLHREWQKLAIEEMRKSHSEGKPGRTDPKVGGVLVDGNNNLLATAFRGEIEKPGHCEYHIFHLKLGGRTAPPNSTLYVTLEPCSNRNLGKIPCADRAIAAGIKTVFIGMIDPDERIEYNGVKKLIEAGIDIRYFDFDLVEEIRKVNKGFILEKKKGR